MMSKFPVGAQIEDILRLSFPIEMNDLVDKALIHPLADFFARPGKKIRNQIVEIGYLLAGTQVKEGASLEVPATLGEQEQSLCMGCADVLEAIHAGSLVVDDIQDGSKVRRGQPALHLRYGLPVALNAGNWLYFWPMRKIKSLGLSAERELQLYQLCHDALLRAHFGQAIDVGVPIDTLPQERVYGVCLASLELKSGALMALAITLGASLGGATPERLAVLEKFGHEFGVALQMFDDLGNLRSKASETLNDYTKRFEDLMLKRPSWIWAVVAKHYPEKPYKDFVNAVDHLPDESFLIPWLELHEVVDVAKKDAWTHLTSAISNLEFNLNDGVREQIALNSIKQLAEKLARAYD